MAPCAFVDQTSLSIINLIKNKDHNNTQKKLPDVIVVFVFNYF